MVHIYRWRHLSSPGIEVLRLEIGHDQMRAHGEVIDAGEKPFALSYDWIIDPVWHTRRLELHLRGADVRDLSIERTGASSWKVDGRERPRLERLRRDRPLGDAVLQ